MTAIIPAFSPGISPIEVRAFSMDFTNSVLTHETIVSASIEIEPAGPTLSQAFVTKNKVLVYVSGCELGVVYHLHFIVQTQSETIDRVGLLPCQEI